jgi:ubiquinone/menaquinone biosynthesis C-methylase UbiE
VEEFLAGLRVPLGRPALPAFKRGWKGTGATAAPFLSYLGTESDLNWSDELEAFHESGVDHFIDVRTREAVLVALRLDGLPAGAVVVDAGCSSGRLLADFVAAAPGAFVVGVDALPAGLVVAHRRLPDVPLFHADVTEFPFGDATVDAMAVLNVLEHVEDDEAALSELRRVLRPGGRAAIVVPANRRLYDHYDRLLQHERRYDRGELTRKAWRAGLITMSTEYIGSLVYPAFWAVKTYGRVRHPAPGPEESRALVARSISATSASKAGRAASAVERWLVRAGIRLPFGIRELMIVEAG